MTGDKLALAVLDDDAGGVGPLIELAGRQETEWLEFKSVLVAPPDPDKRQNYADFHWHVARALIAMVNGRGGVVLIGVGDRGEAIGIEASDLGGVIPREGLENFLREGVLAKVCPAQGWATGRDGQISLDSRLDAYVHIRKFEYDGKTVAALIAEPLPEDGVPLLVTEEKRGRQILLVRARGDIGWVKTIFKHAEVADELRKRPELLRRTELRQIWERFAGEGRGHTPASSAVTRSLAAIEQALGNTAGGGPNALQESLRRAVQAGDTAGVEAAWVAAHGPQAPHGRQAQGLLGLLASAGAAAACHPDVSESLLVKWWERGSELWRAEKPRSACAIPLALPDLARGRLASVNAPDPSPEMLFWTAWWLAGDDLPAEDYRVYVPFTFFAADSTLQMGRLTLVPWHGRAGCVFAHPDGALEPAPEAMGASVRAAGRLSPCCCWRLSTDTGSAIPSLVSSEDLPVVAAVAFRLLEKGVRYHSRTLIHAAATSSRHLRPAAEEEQLLALCARHRITQLGLAPRAGGSPLPSGDGLWVAEVWEMADAERLASSRDEYRLPHHFVPRITELRDLIGLMHPDASASPRVFVMCGMGGLGKTTLSKALLHDPRIQDRFEDSLAFVTAGQQADAPGMLRSAALQLGLKLGALVSIEEARRQLDRFLFSRPALILVDDVWDPDVLRVFTFESARVRVLVTSRLETIAEGFGGAHVHHLELPQEPVARRILSRAVRLAEEGLPPEAAEIVRLCGSLPLALSIIGCTIHTWSRSMSPAAAWKEAVRALRSADLASFPMKVEGYELTLLKAIEISIVALDCEVREAYLDCAVFADGSEIPLSVLALWSGRGEGEIDRTVASWAEASLATVQGSRRLVIHDLLRKYLRAKRSQELQSLHRSLVDAYLKACDNRPADGPNDGLFFNYFLRWLAQHMHEAGDDEAVAGLCGDAAWIQAKLERLDVAAVIGDFDALPDHPDARLIQDALRLSADALAQDPSCGAAQLCGRLSGMGGDLVARLVDGFRRLDTVRLLPVNACLQSPGEPQTPRPPVNGMCQVFAKEFTTWSGSSLQHWSFWTSLKRRATRELGLRALAYLPQQDLALCAGNEGELFLVGRETKSIGRTDSLAVMAVVGETVALVLTESGAVAVVDLAGGAVLSDSMVGDSPASALLLSHDKHSYFVATRDGCVTRFESAHSARRFALMAFDHPVTALLELEAAGPYISGHEDGTVLQWIGSSVEEAWEVQAARGPIRFLSNGGGFLATSAGGREIRLWYEESGFVAGSFLADAPISGLLISPSGKHVLFGDSEGRVGMLEVRAPAPPKKAVIPVAAAPPDPNSTFSRFWKYCAVIVFLYAVTWVWNAVRGPTKEDLSRIQMLRDENLKTLNDLNAFESNKSAFSGILQGFDWDTCKLSPARYLLLATRRLKVQSFPAVANKILILGIITQKGKRQLVAVAAGNPADETDWRTLIDGAKARGLASVDNVVSTSATGLAAARLAFPDASRTPPPPAHGAKLGEARWLSDLEFPEVKLECLLPSALTVCMKSELGVGQMIWSVETAYLPE